MKRLGKALLILALLLVLAFAIFRTPDTDPAEMRAKYGGEPSQFIELEDGMTVHLRDEGPRDAPAIILLHGSSADLHTWQPWTEALRGEYRIIRFDQIGHGLTGPALDGEYELEAFVATVDAVADQLGLEKFVLGGNSMGGWIAIGYALEHPERLAGLILVDASGAPVKSESGGGNIGFAIAATPGLNQMMKYITPRSLVEESYRQSVSNQSIVTEQGIDRYWELLRFPGNRAATIARFNTPRATYTEEQIAGLDVPVLIVWGEDDALVPLAAAEWFAENLPDASVVSYPGIGHLPMEETPEESAAAVRQWLGERALSTETG